MMSEKIRPHHLERKAILYVRQSSAHQVLHNRESSVLQYAMRDRLIALGWSEIETVDDDLGRSAAGGVARAGFERMVAEVCLGKVGAVAARELAQAFQSLVRPLLSRTEAELRVWRDAFRQALGPNGLLIVDLVPELKVIIGEQPPVPALP